jgi:hypothetical protein
MNTDYTAYAIWNTTQNIRDCIRVAKMAKSVEDVNWLIDTFLRKYQLPIIETEEL